MTRILKAFVIRSNLGKFINELGAPLVSDLFKILFSI